MKYILTYIFTTLFRFFPIPGKTGLYAIGHPNKNSPVILTGNFQLTIAIVKHALRGLDAYLLVANSHGINIWCAATGGHLTNHSIISVIKTSGIERKVAHRTVILPQLAATGVERRIIEKKTGWKVEWGPIEAKDIPEYLKHHTIAMDKRQTRFPLANRLEMATAWFFLVVMFNAIIFAIFLPSYLLITTEIIAILSYTMYISLPIYLSWMTHAKIKGISNPRQIFIQILFSCFTIAGLHIYNLTGKFSDNEIMWLDIYVVVIIIILSFDLMGTTPLFKSSMHPDFEVQILEDRCRGVSDCELVCPKNCFEIVNKKAYIPDHHRCIHCGACIVQCPFDALQFINNKGEVIPPQVTREYKLNLMGKRTIHS